MWSESNLCYERAKIGYFAFVYQFLYVLNRFLCFLFYFFVRMHWYFWSFAVLFHWIAVFVKLFVVAHDHRGNLTLVFKFEFWQMLITICPSKLVFLWHWINSSPIALQSGLIQQRLISIMIPSSFRFISSTDDDFIKTLVPIFSFRNFRVSLVFWEINASKIIWTFIFFLNVVKV